MKTTVVTLFIATIFVVTLTILIRMLSPYIGSPDIKIFTSGGVLVSLDGGAHWIESAAKDGNFGDLRVNDWEYFTDGALHKILVSTNVGIFISEDQGLTFERAFKDVISGVVFDVAVDSSGASLVYFAAIKDAAGKSSLIKSSDNGRTFQEIFAFSDGAGDVVGVSLNASQQNIVRGLLSKGLFVQSADGGSTWSHTELGAENFIELSASPANPNLLFAHSGLALFRSTNGGTNWQNITSILSRDIGTTQINNFYIGDSGIFLASSSGIWRSLNKGDSFEKIEFILPARSVTLTAIGANPHDGRTIFAGASENVYKSTDSGLSWKVVTAARSGSVKFLSINPENTEIIYAGILK